MHSVEVFAATHPLWDWLALGALLLALEVGSASGYLLWPAASAGAVGLLTLVAPLGQIGQIVVFSGLTIVTTYIGRRYLRPAAAMPGPDLNDKTARLIGRAGHVAQAFDGGRGRVFVDGSEWAAEVEPGGEAPAKGARVEVVEVLGGGRLKVRAA
jgi:membrane protein implicated in regulation of membrane protease activity